MSGMRLRVVASVMRKDVRAIKPFIALSLVLPAAAVVAREVIATPAAAWAPYVAYVTSLLATLAVLHEDAPSSIRQDFLVRPLHPAELIAAKGLLLLTLMVAPWMLAKAGAALANGSGAVGAVLQATSVPALPVLGWLITVAVGALTMNIRAAAAVFILMFGGFVVVPPIVGRMSGIYEDVLFLGSGWIHLVLFASIVVVMSALTVRSAYMRRSAHARWVFVSGIAATVLIQAIPWQTVFAIQRATGPSSQTGDSLRLTLASCLPAELAHPDGQGVTSSTVREIWPADERDAVGRDALAIRTVAVPSGVAPDRRLMVGRVHADYTSVTGETLVTLRPARFTPAWIETPQGAGAVHDWLLPRPLVERLVAQPVRLRLTYSLSVLAPAASGALAVDGRRYRLQGIGFCTAEPAGGIAVDCFKRGSQPALLVAGLAETPVRTWAASGAPDYMPSVLEVLSGVRHRITVATRAATSNVQLVAFEPEAHLVRTIEAEGVLGAPPDRCPVPGRNHGS